MTAAALRARPLPEAARVLVIDDSVVARAVIGRVIDGSERYVVGASVSDVPAALAFLARAAVDYILLDIRLPGVDGVTALPDLLAAGGGAKVLIVSSTAADGAAITVQALALGAADTLEKPATGEMSSRFGAALLDKLDGLSAADQPARPAIVSRPAAGREAYDVVAIGASTGGIHALGQLLRELPQSFRLPVLITQHLPSSFIPYFAAQLAHFAGRPCDIAADRMRVRPGRLIVAPGEAHMRCVPASDGGVAIRLSREPAPSGCTPSVDPMFASVAAVYGARSLGVVLSGMGRDGAEGSRLLRDAGSSVVVQDPATSVVWGMPGVVAGQGLAEAILAPDAIGRLIAEGRRP